MTDKIMGRPRIELDFEELNKLLEYQASVEEIAGWFNCSIDTVQTRIEEQYGMTFSAYSASFRGKGKLSLRRKQYQEAMKGNTSLLIWLGKQYLAQTDKQESTVDQKTIQINIDKTDSEL